MPSRSFLCRMTADLRSIGHCSTKTEPTLGGLAHITGRNLAAGVGKAGMLIAVEQAISNACLKRCSPCSNFERVQHVHVQSLHVSHIACHEGQAIGLRRGGQECIDDRHRADRIHPAPLLGNSRIDG